MLPGQETRLGKLLGSCFGGPAKIYPTTDMWLSTVITW